MAFASVFLMEATLAFDKLYTYEIPMQLEGRIVPGVRVTVPFGRGDSERQAIVWSVEDELPLSDKEKKADKVDKADKEAASTKAHKIKAIKDVQDDGEVVLYEDQLDLIRQMSIRYSCTHGDAARLMLPPGAGQTVNKRTERTAYLTDVEASIDLLNSGSLSYMNQVHVLEFLINYGESSTTDIMAACQVSMSTLNTMKKKSWLDFSTREAAIPQDVILPERSEAPPPTDGQSKALETLTAAVRGGDERRIKEYLLRGITGSGKTEVYLQICDEVLRAGQTAIILVPEISLTPQMTSRFQARFGHDVAIVHSRLTLRERYDQWLKILRQEVRLVVGARSAIFSPLQNLGLIVIDEEQESSYQSEMRPRYHAKTVARLRIRDRKALLVLGSATPDVESYYRCKTDRSILLDLPDRPGTSILPETKIVDMREEHLRGNYSPFSAELLDSMKAAFSRNEQVMLFLNRRGYAGNWICPDCGKSVICPNCSVAMTYHRAFRNRQDSLQCHYCGRIDEPRHVCPHCKGKHMQSLGYGTEQVEELFKEVFPEQRILRMDQDTTIGRGSHHEIVKAFHEHQADVLLGTQMIAKGHDFPLVTVVGILGADQLLLQNDFRAKERAFQLITQAAGRAGRADLPGHVYVQSYDVDDYALKHALNQDYVAFYEDEILFREAMHYPPFSTMGQVLLSHPNDSIAREEGEAMQKLAQRYIDQRFSDGELQITPLSRSPIYRLNRRYRWQFNMKAASARSLVLIFDALVHVKLDEDSRISLELDPA